MEPTLDNLVKFELADDCRFFTGTLPFQHGWDEPTFQRAWNLHPQDRHLIRLLGKLIPTPRWQQSYGANYSYTGSKNHALPIPALFHRLLLWSQEVIDRRLNGLLLNWYEGPSDYIGPHHDSVKGLIHGTPIVTVSFGEQRTFRLSRGRGAGRQSRNFDALDGTVFVMPWETNLAWKHAVPKRTSYTARRISVTFRAFETGVLPPENYLAE